MITEGELEPYAKRVELPEREIPVKVLRASKIGILRQIIQEPVEYRRGRLEKVVKDLSAIIRRIERKQLQKAKAA